LALAVCAGEFSSQDIPGGSTTQIDAASYDVVGVGDDIWGTQDAFRFVSQSYSGNFDIRARIASLENSDGWAKAGLMVRQSSDRNSVNAIMLASAGNGFVFQHRDTVAAQTSATSGGWNSAPNSWVRLTRAGNQITGHISSDGVVWFPVDSVTLNLTDPVLVGMAVTPHRSDFATSKAEFRNVSLAAYNPPLGTGDGLAGYYFNTADLNGPVIADQVDATVNFDWVGGTPATGVSSTSFSVRWLGQVEPQFSETYSFYTVSDDGVRLWVNDVLLIDNWTAHWPTENTGDIALEAGQKYDVKMEYFQGTGGSVAKLLWSSPSQDKQVIPQSQLYSTSNKMVVGTGDGLLGQYFNRADLGTPAVVTRVDPQVGFDWNTNAPDANVSRDNFAVRWVGQVQAQYTDTYTFYTWTDDGARLWVNGQLLIDKWQLQGNTEWSGTISLVAGQKYDIKMEYFQSGGGANAGLAWSSSLTPKNLIPQTQLYSTGSAMLIGTGTGLQGSYYNTRDLSGTALLLQVDPVVAFDWGLNAPDEAISPDNFSVRWIGEVEAQYSEAYTFYVRCDDGVRLWVGDQLVVDEWRDQSTEYSSASISLTAGVKVPIKLEYFEHTGLAVAQLLWSSASTSKSVVPQTQLYPGAGMTVSIAGSSVVSPTFVEGQAWSTTGLPYALTVTAPCGDLAPTFISDNGWFVNAPLNSDGTATPITINHAGSGIAKSSCVTWQVTDLSTKESSSDSIVIRKGDALLLSASGTGDVLAIDADGDGTLDFTGSPGSLFPFTYATAGTYVATALIDGVVVGTFGVTVVDVGINGPIACQIGFTRQKDASVYPPAATSSITFSGSGPSLVISVKETTATGAALNLSPQGADRPSLVARVGGPAGPIIAWQVVEGFTFCSTARTAVALDHTLDDGTKVCVAYLKMTPLITDDPSIEITLSIRSAGVAFDGGVSSIAYHTSDFTSAGYLPYSLYFAPGTDHGCHTIDITEEDPVVIYAQSWCNPTVNECPCDPTIEICP
jgi:regulation of enolase protein 1 (concanavalin A-like superfamily)